MNKEYLTYNELKESRGKIISYNDLLLTVEWRNKRAEIIKRDENKCSKCKKLSTIPHYEEKNGKNLNIWFGEDESCLVKQTNGKYIETYSPKITVSDKAYHMQVHHKLYIINQLPWNYDNNDLITLCNWCHHELHQNENINIFSEDKTQKMELTSCNKCFGTGYLPEFSYYQNGVCFECNGDRYKEKLIL